LPSLASALRQGTVCGAGTRRYLADGVCLLFATNEGWDAAHRSHSSPRAVCLCLCRSSSPAPMQPPIQPQASVPCCRGTYRAAPRVRWALYEQTLARGQARCEKLAVAVLSRVEEGSFPCTPQCPCHASHMSWYPVLTPPRTEQAACAAAALRPTAGATARLRPSWSWRKHVQRSRGTVWQPRPLTRGGFHRGERRAAKSGIPV
jgi:hypothetical protein